MLYILWILTCVMVMGHKCLSDHHFPESNLSKLSCPYLNPAGCHINMELIPKCRVISTIYEHTCLNCHTFIGGSLIMYNEEVYGGNDINSYFQTHA